MTLDATGYAAKSTNEVLADLRQAIRSSPQYGTAADLSASSRLGTILGAFADAVGAVWEQSQALYDSFNPNNAEGVALDNVAQIIGLTRRGPINSTATIVISGTVGVTVPAGSVVANSAGDRFETNASVRIGSTGAIQAVVTALDSGAVGVTAGDLTTIVTPVAGWNSVTNLEGTAGRDAETDTELRTRIAKAAEIVGAGTVDAITADLQQTAGVIDALVTENVTDADVTISLVTFPVGSAVLRPHSFTAVLWPDTLDQDTIAEVIWNTKPAGIRTEGNVTRTIQDSQGRDQSVSFRFATSSDVIVEVYVTPDASYPVDGDDQIEVLVLDKINTFGIGESVRPFVLECLIVSNVAGITDIEVRLGVSGGPSPVNATLVIGAGEIAVSSEGNTTVFS